MNLLRSLGIATLGVVAIVTSVASVAASPPMADDPSLPTMIQLLPEATAEQELSPPVPVDTVTPQDQHDEFVWTTRNWQGILVTAEVGVAEVLSATTWFSCHDGRGESTYLMNGKTDPRDPYQLTPEYDRNWVRWSMHGPVSHHRSYGWEFARREAHAIWIDATAIPDGCKGEQIGKIQSRTVDFWITLTPNQETQTVTINLVEVYDEHGLLDDPQVYYGDSQVIAKGSSDPVSALWYIWQNAPNLPSFHHLLDGFVSTVSQEDANDRAYCTAVAIAQHERGGDAATPAMLEQCAADLVHDGIGYWLTPLD